MINPFLAARIIKPISVPKGKSIQNWLDSKSAIWQKEICCKIRGYQKLECRDGGFMDASERSWSGFEASLFVEEFYDYKYKFHRTYVIGAVGFQKYPNEEYQLEFCWIHPFWRKKGFLTRMWPDYKRKFGKFTISHPRSSAMQGFLKSINWKD